ncbi:MAG: hypothetical protein U9R53_03130 [Chloroflexota bacterium]|nr:hypothetical protein [Chloroflexota bacterium]
MIGLIKGLFGLIFGLVKGIFGLVFGILGVVFGLLIAIAVFLALPILLLVLIF